MKTMGALETRSLLDSCPVTVLTGVEGTRGEATCPSSDVKRPAFMKTDTLWLYQHTSRPHICTQVCQRKIQCIGCTYGNAQTMYLCA